MKLTSPEKITQLPWLNLFTVGWKNRNKSGQWIFASRHEQPCFKSGTSAPDSVVIVPIHVGRSSKTKPPKRRLVVCREFRIPLNDYEYAFPAGLKDPGETVEECARRELFEETGLKLTSILRVSPPLYSSAGLTDECTAMVFAECTGKVSYAGHDSAEEIAVDLLDIKQVAALTANTEVKQSGKMWPVLLMFANLGTLEFKAGL